MTDRNIGWPMIYGYIAGWCTVAFGLFVVMTRNTAPDAPALEFKDPNAKTTDNIVAVVKAESQGFGHDADGDPVFYAYHWKRAGEALPDQISDTIAPELTKKGEEWSVEVVPNDGTQGGFLCKLPWRECAGTKSTTITMTVANTPAKAGISFDKREPKPGETVTATATASDPDEGDVVQFTYAWLAPGEDLVPGFTPKYTTPSLPGGTARSGQTWTIVVSATDGTADVAPPTRATVTFQ